MNKFWILFCSLAIFGAVGYADKSYEWVSEEWDDGEIGKSDVLRDKKVQEEIEKFQNDADLNKGDIDDYQIEDNRSEVKQDNDDGSDDEISEYYDVFDDTDMNYEEPVEVDNKKSDRSEKHRESQDSNIPDNGEKNDFEHDDLEDTADIDYELPEMDEGQKKILEETTAILNEDKNDNFEDIEPNSSGEDKKFETANGETKKLLEEAEDIDEKLSTIQSTYVDNAESIEKSTEKDTELTNDSLDENKNLDIIGGTKNPLKETNERLDEHEDDEGFKKDHAIEDVSEDEYSEDTVYKAYKDLQDDLIKLRETWNKLKDDVDGGDVKKEDLPGFEEINSKLADIEHEALENDYEDLDDENMFKLFEEQSEELSEEFDEDDEDLEDGQADNKNVDIGETKLKSDTDKPEEEKKQLSNKTAKYEEVTENAKLIKYVDDALVANDKAETTTSEIEMSSVASHVVQEHNVEPLEVDFDDHVSPFSNLLHDILGSPEKEKDVQEAVKNSAEPKRITLSPGKPIVLTSPNYPNPYPTNAINDWIVEGEGIGIEFIVKDFEVNGNNGDYVLVNPGRSDASGTDGLVFSHMLREERRYRFLNVNKMFIRFEANMGMMWQRGFNFTIMLMDSLPDDDNDTSEPETLPIGFPPIVTTVYLGGVTLEDFLKVKEDFRTIVADMATMYINANRIDPGLNSTLEVTQITSSALCFHNWPKFERCAEVMFGVPLQYEDEDAEPRLNEDDLKEMWWTYSQVDPFVLRLRRLNITEFHIPNDNNILMVWLVIAAGVVISMAMLAFAIWRFSCFEDYSRMPSFSDSDSVNEKKTLDLYPTPHQTLPPLYADTEYRWGDEKFEEPTRVDMGGFANRSYVRTDDYDFESDEEVVVPARDRSASISPRDIYNV